MFTYRKGSWLGWAVLVFLLLGMTAIATDNKEAASGFSFVAVPLLGVWCVRGFFRFVGRAFGHGYHQGVGK